jgi:4-amino-4-deoxy-L-arabinose transferase-like glycosyltransferase
VNAPLEDPASTGHDSTLSPRAWLILMLLALAAFMPGLFSIPAMDRDESRYAQASVQMMETGDFIDIRFQTEPRYKQPVGTYWLQSIAAAPFGGEDAPIGAHRLPGLAFSLLAVALTAWLGARLFSPTIGFSAGLVLAISLMLALEARTAKTDAILLGLGMVAQVALAMIVLREESGRPKFLGWPALLWAAIGASLLVKGPIFFMVTALTLGGYALWKRDASILLKVRPLPGIALALAIFLPWFLAINVMTDWAFAAKAVGWSLLGKVTEAHEAHGGPLGYHLMLSPVTLWPGSVLLVLGVLAAWRYRSDDRVKFLIAWALPTYLVFELVATKLPHYTLPAFPAIALLIAIGMERRDVLLSRRAMSIAFWIFAGLAIAAGLVVAAVPLAGRIFFEMPVGVIAPVTLALGVVAAVAVFALARRPSVNRLVATGVAAAATYTAAFAFAIPGVTPLWTSRDMGVLARSIEAEGCEFVEITVAGYREPSLAFHLGTGTLLANDGEQAADFLLVHRECGLAIVDAAEEPVFTSTVNAANGTLVELGRLEGYNYVKGDPLSLTFYTLEGSGLRRPD